MPDVARASLPDEEHPVPMVGEAEPFINMGCGCSDCGAYHIEEIQNTATEKHNLLQRWRDQHAKSSPECEGQVKIVEIPYFEWQIS